MRLQNSLLYAVEVAVDWMRLSSTDCCETSLLFCRCQSGKVRNVVSDRMSLLVFLLFCLVANQATVLAGCARTTPNDLLCSWNIQMTWKSSGLRSPQSETGANVLQQKMNSFAIGRRARSLRRAGFVPLQRAVSANKEGEHGAPLSLWIDTNRRRGADKRFSQHKEHGWGLLNQSRCDYLDTEW